MSDMEICDDCKHNRGLYDVSKVCCTARQIISIWRANGFHGPKNTEARQMVKKEETKGLGRSAKELSEFREKVSAHIQMILEESKRAKCRK